MDAVEEEQEMEAQSSHLASPTEAAPEGLGVVELL